MNDVRERFPITRAMRECIPHLKGDFITLTPTERGMLLGYTSPEWRACEELNDRLAAEWRRRMGA